MHHGLESDAELIRASATDPQLFRALFERHFAVIFGYVGRRLGREAADDVTAEVFLRAFERRAGYDRRFADARPWLFGIAANLVRRSWRDEKRRLRALARGPAEPVAGRDDEAARDERLDCEAARPALAKALARLRPAERDVLLLVAWADLTYEEAGRALEIPVGTVRSRLHRARAHMRRALDMGGTDDVTTTAPKPGDLTPEPATVKEDVRWMTSI